MWVVELIVVLIFIWLGARLGSIGIGFAGGFGVLVLSLGFGLAPGSIPIDVILIALVCKINCAEVLNAATFKSGMSACVCVLGVAWLGTTFVAAHMEAINVLAGSILETKPWMLAVVLFFASMLLYSQAATTKALMPAALALGVSPVAAIAAFAAVSALFVLPTYPSLLAAVEFDDTGSTRIGKFVFDHPFIIPGTLTITFAVTLGFIIGSFVL